MSIAIADKFIEDDKKNGTAPFNTQWWVMMYGIREKNTIIFKDQSRVTLNEESDWVKI